MTVKLGGQVTSDQEPAQHLPWLEQLAATNSGLFAILATVVGGIFLAVVLAIVPPLRRWAWKFLTAVIVRLVKAGKVVWLWVADRIERLKTPLADRNELKGERSAWATERDGILDDLTKARRESERYRQSANTVAKERDRFRGRLAACEKAAEAVAAKSQAVRPANNTQGADAELKVEQDRDAVALGRGGAWFLRNWGPASVYQIYVTTTDADSRLENEHWDELHPKETVPLFDRYTGKTTMATLGQNPQLRVTYVDSVGHRHEKFLEVPLSHR